MLKNQFWDFATKCFCLEFLILPSSGQLKQTCDTCIIHFYLYARAALAWTKKNVHLEVQIRFALETEEERRARPENDAATKRPR